MCPHEVEIALGRDLVQRAPVLALQLADDLVGALHRLLALPGVDQVNQHQQGQVVVNLCNS